MAKFFCIARDKTGAKFTSSEEGVSADEVVARLQAKGLIVVSVLPASKDEKFTQLRPEMASRAAFKARHSGVTGEDLALFCRQLTTLLGAGVTILKSMSVISKQVGSRKLHNIIRDLERNMEAGLSLHEAMSKHPQVFSELWVNLVESGEASGNLAVVLNRLAGYLERNMVFKRKVISALLYPLILLLAGTAALLFLTIKIIPTFANLFKGFNITLPLLTRLLISVSAFLRGYILIIGGIIAVGLYLIKQYINTRRGRIDYENFKFKLPMFGEFFRSLAVERFSSEMSTLLESGVPILYSLEISEKSVNNLVMAGIIRQVKEEVRDGKTLTAPLEKSGFFEPMVTQMVSIGEEIGELPDMFKRINSFYQEYVETFLTRFTSLFEPIMLLFMGAIIGIMVVGMFLPIFQIAKIGG